MSRDKRILAAIVAGLFLALLLPQWLPADQGVEAAALGAGFLALALLLHCARPFAAGELAVLALLMAPALVCAGESLGGLPVGRAAALALKCLLTLFSGYCLCALTWMLLPRRGRPLANVALSLGAAALYAFLLAPAGWAASAAPPLLSGAVVLYVKRLRDRG